MPPILNQRCHWDLVLVGYRNIAARIQATCVKGLSGSAAAAHGAVMCSRSVSLQMALCLIIKPSDGVSFTSQMGQQWTSVLRGTANGTDRDAQSWRHPSLSELRRVAGQTPATPDSVVQSKVKLDVFTKEFHLIILMTDHCGLLKWGGPMVPSQDPSFFVGVNLISFLALGDPVTPLTSFLQLLVLRNLFTTS